MTKTFLGEFEQMVLLSVLQLGDEALALRILDDLDERAQRPVSRGALYKTLERLKGKGLVEWKTEEGTPLRGGHPRRRFAVTPAGVLLLQESRDRLLRLWTGVEGVLEGEGL